MQNEDLFEKEEAIQKSKPKKNSSGQKRNNDTVQDEAVDSMPVEVKSEPKKQEVPVSAKRGVGGSYQSNRSGVRTRATDK